VFEGGKVDIEILESAEMRFSGRVDEVVEQRFWKAVYKEKMGASISLPALREVVNDPVYVLGCRHQQVHRLKRLLATMGVDALDH
jgi:hypothetical protein